MALGVVVLGHLALAVVDRAPDGSVRGANLLALRPGWSWLAILSPMPVFFTAAGWANLRSDLRSSVPRLRTLIGLGAAVITVWVGLIALTWITTGDATVVSNGARIATQPLWFLAAYIPLVTAGPLIARAARRPVAAVASCLAVLIALDVARFSGGAPEWIGWPGFVAAWSIPWRSSRPGFRCRTVSRPGGGRPDLCGGRRCLRSPLGWLVRSPGSVCGWPSTSRRVLPDLRRTGRSGSGSRSLPSEQRWSG